VDRTLQAFAFEVTASLQQRLGNGFHEVGLDIGLDERGTIKLFEANLGVVGVNFHEYEAARCGIDYALYLVSGKDRLKDNLDFEEN